MHYLANGIQFNEWIHYHQSCFPPSIFFWNENEFYIEGQIESLDAGSKTLLRSIVFTNKVFENYSKCRI